MRPLVCSNVRPSDGRTVVERFLSVVAERPDRPAVRDAGVATSYAELGDWSSRIAAGLVAAGAGKGDVVAVCLPRSAAEIASIVGVVRCGAAFMLLDPRDPQDRIERLLSNAGVRFLVVGDVVEPAPFHAGRVLVDPGCSPQGEASAAMPSSDDLAYVVHTSGSTGRPNAVEISHSNLAALVDWHVGAFSVDHHDRAGHLAGLTFDASVWEIWPHLCSGACLVLAPDAVRTDPAALRDWIVEERLTVAFVPTPVAEPMLRLGWDGAALRFLLVGGDVLRSRPPAGLPFEVVNNYGPSECAVVATSGRVAPSNGNGLSSVPSIGRAIEGSDVHVFDDEGRPVPFGCDGEIFLSGANVGRGYRNDQVLTQAKFPVVDGTRMYRTGDRGHFGADGELRFTGRVDSQVKIRGIRVELDEISSLLMLHPGVVSAAAAVRQGPAGEMLVAYVVPKAGHSASPADLKDFLAGQLPAGLVPGAFVELAMLPLTRHGKIDRAALPDPVLVREGEVDGDESPEGYLQRTIAGMVAEVLSLPTVSRSDDFFLMGGHSLLAAQLATRLRQAFGIEVSLRDLFDGPTVEMLADLVEARLGIGEDVVQETEAAE